jgi:hypothetical protein
MVTMVAVVIGPMGISASRAQGQQRANPYHNYAHGGEETTHFSPTLCVVAITLVRMGNNKPLPSALWNCNES